MRVEARLVDWYGEVAAEVTSYTHRPDGKEVRVVSTHRLKRPTAEHATDRTCEFLEGLPCVVDRITCFVDGEERAL